MTFYFERIWFNTLYIMRKMGQSDQQHLYKFPKTFLQSIFTGKDNLYVSMLMTVNFFFFYPTYFHLASWFFFSHFVFHQYRNSGLREVFKHIHFTDVSVFEIYCQGMVKPVWVATSLQRPLVCSGHAFCHPRELKTNVCCRTPCLQWPTTFSVSFGWPW